MKLIGISGRKNSGKSTLAEELCKKYNGVQIAFADPLKWVAVNIMGLPAAQVYGNDEAKKNKTQYQWKDMPFEHTRSAEDYLTVRNMLQVFGTEIFRRIDPDIWVKALIRRIDSCYKNEELVVVDDVRFPNEVKGLQSKGGYVIRLTRGVMLDEHVSETSLDCWQGFDYKVIGDCNKEETFDFVQKWLDEKWLDEKWGK